MSRILVVDDCSSTLKLLEGLLTEAGHQVSSFDVSSHCLISLENTAFDVAIVDFHMPAPNGVEVLRRIREAQPLCTRILTSGDLDLPVLIDAVNRGEIARVIQKPFDAADLVRIVREAGDVRQRLRRALIETSSHVDECQRQALEESLDTGALRLALQPIVDCRTEAPVAFEALLRSHHPSLNRPLSVIRAAEQHGLLPRLAAVITDHLVDILTRLPDHYRLFVNLHPAELVDPESLSMRASRLSPWSDRLVFEITERSYLMELDGWEAALQLLDDRGFAVALDDLGSGYNSLAMLAQLCPQYIKVDMSIVRGVHRSSRKRRLIHLLSRFARATNALLIAEGVETRREARALRRCSVDLLQGYLFGRPAAGWPGEAEPSFSPPRRIEDRGLPSLDGQM